jgi:phospholipase C
MRFSARILVCLAVFGATLASAQTLHTFKHIVIIVQENRTPDNLFGSGPNVGCGAPNPFEPGVDIQDGGPAAGRGNLCNQPLHLQLCFDLGHKYQPGWLNMWDNGSMDGACGGSIYNPSPGTCQVPTCPQYSYVERSDVQPYFDIATNYGFANYFFQTNEGPSFPAHQFLLAGTSTPFAPGVAGYLDFAAENGGDSYHSGCPASQSYPLWVDPTGTELITALGCYEHQTLVDLLDAGHISWHWYTPTAGSIWTAVNAIKHLCYKNGSSPPAQCDSTDWNNNVILPPPGKGTTSIPFLADIQKCNLQAVSWVIPDERWSDHPRTDTAGAFGPSYVADLVNEIGNSTCPDGGQTYWQDTAIFITWDDWGGFYDHVTPPAVYRSTDPNSCPPAIAPNGWGCGYTYGFRVPLLVVSAYTPAGYVSGDTRTHGGGYQKQYTHDFGSILAFIEHNFNLGPIAQPYYADFNAIDHVSGNIPLSDFFLPGLYRSFTPIIPATGFDKNYFQTYYTTPQNGVLPQPEGPDGDDAD